MASAKESADVLPTRLFEKPSAWEKWLEKNAAKSPGIWMRLSKSVELASVSYAEALDIALCFGWIDGQKQRCDEVSWLQKFTPRRPRSIWSQINRAKAIKLIEQKKMRKQGQEAIDQAKANGQWEAAYESSKIAMPEGEFEAALRESPKARAAFNEMNSQNRYAMLFRIKTAKKEETKRKRIEQFVSMLERGEKLYP